MVWGNSVNWQTSLRVLLKFCNRFTRLHGRSCWKPPLSIKTRQTISVILWNFKREILVYVFLTRDQVPAGECNKLAARKIGMLEIVEKINTNAYRLKLPRHILTSNVFNVKHLVPFLGDSSSDEDSNSMTNSFQDGVKDTELIGYAYMERFDRSAAKR